MSATLPSRLQQEFYAGHTVDVAKALLGKVIVRRSGPGHLLGRIVETEAYHGPEDQACHAAKGHTPRTAPMFEAAGRAYVYQIYGMWFCLNAVTGPEGFPCAVLIRAVEPIPQGSYGHKEGAGPGKLCRRLQINKELNRADLVGGEDLWIGDDGHTVAAELIRSGPRIGVDYAGEWALTPWRFWVSGSRSVSKGKSAVKA